MAKPDKKSYELSEAEQRDLVTLIQQGKALPEKYRFILFEDKREVELVWNGKTRDVCTTVLPFQTLEHVDEPRTETRTQGDMFDSRGRQQRGWSNKLIWGDNKLILSSLKAGPLRQQIEDAGGLKLIYIDPPFDVGADFSMDIEIGGETFHKEPNLLEQIAYRDTWGRGADSFISMIYERLILMRDLLATDGSIYVHCDWRVNAFIRSIMDEVFGRAFFCNEIAWQRSSAHNDANRFGVIHDSVFFFSRGERWIFNPIFSAYDDTYIAERFRSVEEGTGRRYWLNTMTAAGSGPPKEFNGAMLPPPNGTHWRYSQENINRLIAENRIAFSKSGTPYVKQYLDESEGRPAQSIWTDVVPSKSGAEQQFSIWPNPLLRRGRAAS